MIKNKYITLLIVLFITIGQPLFAQQSKAHRGLFMRAIGGGGFSNSTMDRNGSEYKYSGAVGFFQAEAGWAFWDNFILFGSFGIMGMGTFDYTIDGMKQGLQGTEFKTKDFGAGVSYYLMPSNVYISLGFSSSETELSFGLAEIESDNGWGSTLTIGKEWMLSKNWGLGVAGLLYYGVVPRGSSSMVNTYFGIAITTTYNSVESRFKIN